MANALKVYQDELIQACKERHLKLSKILCIQRVEQEEIGGIRLLPFDKASAKKIDHHHQFLLEWISHFGLSANRVELDRWVPPSDVSTHGAAFLPIEKPSKEEVPSLGWTLLSGHPSIRRRHSCSTERCKSSSNYLLTFQKRNGVRRFIA